jgi:hypothetical protein
MKLAIRISFLLLAVFAGTANAQNGNFGLGVIVGEPTGLSLKAWQTNRTALDFAAAWSFVEDGSVHLHGDILRHRYSAIEVEDRNLPFYYGIGARVKMAEDGGDPRFGIRFPLGLDFLFNNDPLDLFVEAVPILDVSPESDVSLNASVGMRYWP